MTQQDNSKKIGDNGTKHVTIIKKYANRRLYNTDSSAYVTLENLSAMVKKNEDFVVQDAKSGDDITQSVLTQIIMEEEGKGHPLLPVSFLRTLIGLYDNNLQSMVPGYLDYALKMFLGNQDRMQDYFSQTFGTLFPFGSLEEVSKQNMAFFENALKMFTPGLNFAPPSRAAPSEPVKPLHDLQRKLEELQQQIASLSQNDQK